MKASDVMSRPVVSVAPTMPVRSAIVLLIENNFGALPVVSEGERLLGVVSEGDLLRSSMRGASVGAVVSDVMTSPVTTVPMNASLTELAEVLLDGKLRCVPVVDHGMLVGVISRSDLLRTLVHDDDVLADHVRRLVHAYAGTRPKWLVEVVDGVVWITGPFTDEAERRIVLALARTVPGVDRVELRPAAAFN
jgi:CBS domain-containing protein